MFFDTKIPPKTARIVSLLLRQREKVLKIALFPFFFAHFMDKYCYIFRLGTIWVQTMARMLLRAMSFYA
jgi:hypothetical protein